MQLKLRSKRQHESKHDGTNINTSQRHTKVDHLETEETKNGSGMIVSTTELILHQLSWQACQI